MLQVATSLLNYGAVYTLQYRQDVQQTRSVDDVISVAISDIRPLIKPCGTAAAI